MFTLAITLVVQACAMPTFSACFAPALCPLPQCQKILQRIQQGGGIVATPLDRKEMSTCLLRRAAGALVASGHRLVVALILLVSLGFMMDSIYLFAIVRNIMVLARINQHLFTMRFCFT